MTADSEVTVAADAARLARVRALIAESADCPLATLRILDLACRTGSFAIPLAQDGATVSGVEGNTANLAVAFQRTALPNLVLIHADVREFDQWQGRYDVTLCLGLLYHLELPSVVLLLRQLARCTEVACIIDTHVGRPDEEWTIDGQSYRGSLYSDQPGHAWGSLGNTVSAWLDLPSLLQLVRCTGFTDVRVVPGAAYPEESADRVWLVATV